MNKLEFTRFPSLDYASREAINTLCTNLSFTDGEKRTIMITSCHPDEGKSFLTMNIMRTLAQLGYRVAMVDADMRKSRISSRYGLRIVSGKGYGTSHYLSNKCSLEDALYETNIANVFIMPVRHVVSNSLSLLSSNRTRQMMKELGERFDFVLVDAPPVGTIVDAVEIAKSCDGTLFVVKYNTVSRRELVEAKRQVERSGCAILGAVLNEVDLDSLSSKHYYHKSYYSNYESEYYEPTRRKRRKKPAVEQEKE